MNDIQKFPAESAKSFLEGKVIEKFEILANNSIVLHTKEGRVEITSESMYIGGVSIPVLEFFARLGEPK